jgi:methyl-accepting chemotaxis protein
VALSPGKPAVIEEAAVAWSDDHVKVTAPVVTESGTRGMLTVLVSTQTIHQEMHDSLVAVATMGLLVLGAAFIAAYFVARSIGGRLGTIAGVADRVARGDLSHTAIHDTSGDEIGGMTASLNLMLSAFTALAQRVRKVADGDLSDTTNLKGDLPEAVNRMIVSQREMVGQIVETSLQLNSAAEEFVANARQQENGATEQSSAVEETRRTMDSLLGSAREIGQTSQSVLQIAEKTQTNSQLVAERIAALSAHTQRISEILEIIKDIANKSDLLALNAAIEGTKAGEAGRGFLLVATQMQRLAENVMGSVRDIKELTATITDATQASVLAIEEATKLAADTTRSARQIALIIQQQQTGTEQVSKAMDDVAQIAVQSAGGSKQIVTSANDLLRLAERLRDLVGRFQLGQVGKPGKSDGDSRRAA